jgi:predicted XRE-type DNA-binding protein
LLIDIIAPHMAEFSTADILAKVVRFDSGDVGALSRRNGFIEKDGVDMRKTKLRATKGSGNVFADLGLPNPEQELLKARLTLEIYKIVKERGLAQARAGEILGIKQPHVLALMRNRAGNFSVGRLMEFLTALGRDVEITVKPTRKAQGEMSVVMR